MRNLKCSICEIAYGHQRLSVSVAGVLACPLVPPQSWWKLALEQAPLDNREPPT